MRLKNYRTTMSSPINPSSPCNRQHATGSIKASKQPAASKIRILYVCMGNICRSPVAEATMLRVAEQANQSHRFQIESCGTSSYHIGSPPDARSQSVAKEYDIVLQSRAAAFVYHHFSCFDYIFAMDHQNYFDMLEIAKTMKDVEKVEMFRKYDPEGVSASAQGFPESLIAKYPQYVGKVENILAVPDPYFGGGNGFYNVQEMILRTCKNFLQTLREKHTLS